ncbi:MAG: hypothetical protein JW940_31615 [Polyangiaceae bacterium]|nr:hypothetical protein [Polyangiaceae bacterium]
MILRQNGLGLSAVLSLVSFCLGYSAPALAEEEAPSALTPAASDEAAAEPAAAAAEPPAAEPAPEPAKEAEPAEPPVPQPAAKPTQKAEMAAPSEPPPATAPTTASGTSQEREKAVSLLGVELLPGSAYPSIQTRGIKYGSLWQTFHGQQWPYMPLIEGGQKLRIGFSGFVWNDLSNTRIAVDKGLTAKGINKQNRWTTQTRGGLRVTPTYNAKDDWFVQGNAEFIVHGDMRPDPVTGVLGSTDDLWVRAGKWNLFDVTVGRFQGWEIANHYGMALDQNTLERSGAWLMNSSLPRPTDGYGLTYFWDRQDVLLGGYALHVYPTEFLRAELLGHLGAGTNTSSPFQTDFRPSAIFDIGWVKLKGGWEYGKAIPQDAKLKQRNSRNGYGFAGQFVWAPYVEFGGSLGRGFEDVLDINGNVNLEATNSVTTYGGFLNASPGYEPVVLGIGAFLNHQVDFRLDYSPGPHQGKVDLNDQTQLFGAAQYTLWDCFYIKGVFAYAKNHVEHYDSGIYTNKSYSGRLRAMVLF